MTVLGRLPFVGERLLADLRSEAERQRPATAEDAIAHGQPGDVLARLAVSRQLREVVSAAVGMPVVSTHEAVYQYHGPDSAVRPHRDKSGYDVVFHMTLDHVGVDADSEGSVLEVFGDEGMADRMPLEPGECVVLRGRHAVHGWTRLGPRERRTLVAIGFSASNVMSRRSNRGERGVMPRNDDVEADEDTEAQSDPRLPDLDVTDESGKAVKGGIPKTISDSSG